MITEIVRLTDEEVGVLRPALPGLPLALPYLDSLDDERLDQALSTAARSLVARGWATPVLASRAGGGEPPLAQQIQLHGPPGDLARRWSAARTVLAVRARWRDAQEAREQVATLVSGPRCWVLHEASSSGLHVFGEVSGPQALTYLRSAVDPQVVLYGESGPAAGGGELPADELPADELPADPEVLRLDVAAMLAGAPEMDVRVSALLAEAVSVTELALFVGGDEPPPVVTVYIARGSSWWMTSRPGVSRLELRRLTRGELDDRLVAVLRGRGLPE